MIFDFFVNVDNKHLRSAQKASREDPELLKAKFTYALVLLGIAMIRDTRDGPGNEGDDDDDGDGEHASVEDAIAKTTAAVAQIVLPMIDVIGRLSGEDVSV